MIKNIQKYIRAESVIIILLALCIILSSINSIRGAQKESAEVIELHQLTASGEEYKKLEEQYRKEWEKTIWAKRCNEARLKEKINSGSTIIDCTKDLEKWASYNNREQGL